MYVKIKQHSSSCKPRWKKHTKKLKKIIQKLPWQGVGSDDKVASFMKHCMETHVVTRKLYI